MIRQLKAHNCFVELAMTVHQHHMVCHGPGFMIDRLIHDSVASLLCT